MELMALTSTMPIVHYHVRSPYCARFAPQRCKQPPSATTTPRHHGSAQPPEHTSNWVLGCSRQVEWPRSCLLVIPCCLHRVITRPCTYNGQSHVWWRSLGGASRHGHLHVLGEAPRHTVLVGGACDLCVNSSARSAAREGDHLVLE